MNRLEIVIDRAQKNALRRDNKEVGVEHVIRALLESLDGDHPIRKSSEAIGVTVESLDKLIDARYPTGAPTDFSGERSLCKEAADLVISLAKEWVNAKAPVSDR